MLAVEQGTEYNNNTKCHFCRKDQEGYAKQDRKGNWHPACWSCVKPAQINEPKNRRNKRGYLGPIASQGILDDVLPSPDDTIHETRTELATDNATTVLRTNMGTDGEQGGGLPSGGAIQKRKRIRISSDVPPAGEAKSSDRKASGIRKRGRPKLRT